MIFIPPIVVINTINDFCIFFFRDRNHNVGAPPHFHIVFPVNAEDDLVVTIITSQIESQQQYYRRINRDALDSLIHVNKDIFGFLKKDSIIDCNHAELLTRYELANRVDKLNAYNIKSCAIPAYLKVEICAAIKKSPLISQRLRRIVKEYMKKLG